LLISNPKCLAKIHDFEMSVGTMKVKASLSFKSLIQETAGTATYHTRSVADIKDHLTMDLATSVHLISDQPFRLL